MKRFDHDAPVNQGGNPNQGPAVVQAQGAQPLRNETSEGQTTEPASTTDGGSTTQQPGTTSGPGGPGNGGTTTTTTEQVPTMDFLEVLTVASNNPSLKFTRDDLGQSPGGGPGPGMPGNRPGQDQSWLQIFQAGNRKVFAMVGNGRVSQYSLNADDVFATNWRILP